MFADLNITSIQFFPQTPWPKTMLHGLSSSLSNSVMSHLFFIPYIVSLLKKGSFSNSLHFALNLWMVLPPPTSQIFFTFTLLLASSVILQASECSEYHPFTQSPVVRALSRTQFQLHETNSAVLSIAHSLSVLPNFPWKPFFSKL